jgi:hypothetical protein
MFTCLYIYSNEGAFSRAGNKSAGVTQSKDVLLTVLCTSPVAAPSPAAVNTQLEVIHHGVLEQVDDAVTDLVRLGRSPREDGPSVQFRLEVILNVS